VGTARVEMLCQALPISEPDQTASTPDQESAPLVQDVLTELVLTADGGATRHATQIETQHHGAARLKYTSPIGVWSKRRQDKAATANSVLAYIFRKRN